MSLTLYFPQTKEMKCLVIPDFLFDRRCKRHKRNMLRYQNSLAQKESCCAILKPLLMILPPEVRLTPSLQQVKSLGVKVSSNLPSEHLRDSLSL
jgi:hypothetical protein